MDEIRHVIVWYIVLTALGWLGFPIAYRLLPALKDRGYSLSRTLGLLLSGYIFWMLASLGIVRNDATGVLFAAALLGLLTLWALRGVSPQELRAWLRSQRAMIIAVEALFLLAFAGWAWVRAANPEALGTEKPMELAFINAILGSPAFPPHDPWLSGYAISYYYFGYVLVAMLARLAETSGALAFNLGISAVFALTATGAYGIVFNLVNARTYERAGRHDLGRPRYTLAALLAPLFVLIVSNLEGFLHLLHNWGVFWQRTPSGEATSWFWSWLDILDLNQPPLLPPESFAPTRFWWWWRASRVVQDYDLAGGAREIIDEFPFFSYLLGDVHPHVLAMPFGMLALGLALNLFLGGSRTATRWPKLRLRRGTLATLGAVAVPVGMLAVGLGAFQLMRTYSALNGAGGLMAAASAGGAGGLVVALLGAALVIGGGMIYIEQSGGRLAAARGGHVALSADETAVSIEIPFNLNPAFALLAAVTLGGLAFLNTWDFPVYVAITAAAYAFGQALRLQRPFRSAIAELILLGVALGAAGGLLYWPFYLGFSSQAGGILPNVVYPTRGAHLWVMFAPLMLPILAWLAYLARRVADRKIIERGFVFAAGLLIALWALSLLLAAAIIALPEAGQAFLSSVAAKDGAQLFLGAFQRRMQNAGGWLTLLLLLTPILALLIEVFLWGPASAKIPKTSPADRSGSRETSLEHTEIFVLLLALVGGLLVLGPEFFFLRDLFGWRMNTIFKFYFQAWQIWGIVAAYSAIILLARLRGAGRVITGAGLIVLLVMALVYPILSLDSKTNHFNPPVWTLDGANYFTRQYPDEAAAVQWLQMAPMGVIAEAVPPRGGSYSEYARFATLSGKPGVLGWVGHENQWRGESSAQTVGTRQSDLQQLYCTRSWSEARAVIDHYNIRYIVVGLLERSNYVPDSDQCPSGLIEVKFQRNLQPAFQAGGVTIYEFSGEPND